MATLISNMHTRITATPVDEPITIDLPAEIGDDEGQVPQSVADFLVHIAQYPGEYEIVEGGQAGQEKAAAGRGRKAKAEKGADNASNGSE